jgi:hypothetical protein
MVPVGGPLPPPGGGMNAVASETQRQKQKGKKREEKRKSSTSFPGCDATTASEALPFGGRWEGGKPCVETDLDVD